MKHDGWAIKGPAGGIILNTFRDNSAKAKEQIIDNDPEKFGSYCEDYGPGVQDPFETWDKYKKRGYRCVRVNLTEVES